MKRFLKALSVVVAIWLMMTASGCVYSSARMEPEEYRSGSDYAEVLAKQDAISTVCIRVRGLGRGRAGYHLEMMRNRDRHLEAMGTDKSPSYINGFKRGYEESFFNYMDLYCED